LLDQIDAEIASVTADGARPWRRQHGDHPPHVTAVLSDDAAHNSSQRDKHIASIAAHGRLGWQKESGYGRRALVETAMGRYKAIIGPRLRARSLLANARKRPSTWPCSTACCTPDRPTPSAARTELLELAWGRGSFARVRYPCNNAGIW
jgi:hypothetical protein